MRHSGNYAGHFSRNTHFSNSEHSIKKGFSRSENQLQRKIDQQNHHHLANRELLNTLDLQSFGNLLNNLSVQHFLVLWLLGSKMNSTPACTSGACKM